MPFLTDNNFIMKITIEIDHAEHPEVQVSSAETTPSQKLTQNSGTVFKKTDAIDAGPAEPSLQIQNSEQSASVPEILAGSSSGVNVLSAGAAPK
jgi:hypothetical protein